MQPSTAPASSSSSRPHAPEPAVRNRSSEPAGVLSASLNNDSGSSVSSQAISTPPTSPLHPENGSSIQQLSSRVTHRSDASSKKPGKKRGTSFFSFFTLKEPSTEAFANFQTDVRRQVASHNGRPMAVGLPGVSSAKLPESVPKVNSKWDGLPQAVRDRERQQREQRRSARLSGISSGTGMSSILGRTSSRSSSSAVSSDSTRGRHGTRVSGFSDRSDDLEALFSDRSANARPPSLSSSSDTKSGRHSPKSLSPARAAPASISGTGLPVLEEPEEDFEHDVVQAMSIFTDGSPESLESTKDPVSQPPITNAQAKNLSPTDAIDKRAPGVSYTSTGKRYINFSKPHPRGSIARPSLPTVPEPPPKSARRKAKPLPFPAGEAQPLELPD